MFLKLKCRLLKIGDKLLERGLEYSTDSFSPLELAQLRQAQYCPGNEPVPAVEFYSESLAPKAKKNAEAAPAAG